MNVEKEILNLKSAINQHAGIINTLADKLDAVYAAISKKTEVKLTRKKKEEYFSRDSLGNLIPLVEDDSAESEG